MRTVKTIIFLLLAAMAALPLSAQKKVGEKHGPAIIENWVLLGVKAYDSGEYGRAESIFEAVLAEDDSNDAAYYYLGMCAIMSDNPDAEKAEAFLRKAVELDRGNYWYRSRLASLYQMTGRTEVTVRMLEEMLEDFPKKDELYYTLVDLYIGQQRYEDALGKLDDLELIFGKSDGTVMTRYQLLLQLRKQEEAHAVLTSYSEEYTSPQVLSVLGDYEYSLGNDAAAMDYYSEALEADSDYPAALLGRAEVFRTSRRYDEYFASLYDFLSRENIPSGGKADYLSELTRQSSPQFRKSFGARLDKAFELTLHTHPADTAVLFAGGVHYLGSGNVEKADSCFRAIPAACPDDARAHRIFCEYLGYSGDWSALEKEAQDSYVRFGDAVFLDYSLSAAHQAGDFEKLEDLLILKVEEAAKAGDRPAALEALAVLADVYHETGEDKKAFKIYNKCLKIAPDYSHVLNNYAYFLSLQGRKLSKAAAMSRKTVEAEPDNATYLDTFGWILYLQKKLVESKGVFKHAMLYGGKESATILDHYAEVLYALKEYDLAFIYWQQALGKGGETEIPGLKEKIAQKKAQMK